MYLIYFTKTQMNIPRFFLLEGQKLVIEHFCFQREFLLRGEKKEMRKTVRKEGQAVGQNDSEPPASAQLRPEMIRGDIKWVTAGSKHDILIPSEGPFLRHYCVIKSPGAIEKHRCQVCGSGWIGFVKGSRSCIFPKFPCDNVMKLPLKTTLSQ